MWPLSGKGGQSPRKEFKGQGWTQLRRFPVTSHLPTFPTWPRDCGKEDRILGMCCVYGSELGSTGGPGMNQGSLPSRRTRGCDTTWMTFGDMMQSEISQTRRDT